MTRRNGSGITHREPLVVLVTGPEGREWATETEYTLFAYCKVNRSVHFLMIVSSASIGHPGEMEME